MDLIQALRRFGAGLGLWIGLGLGAVHGAHAAPPAVAAPPTPAEVADLVERAMALVGVDFDTTFEIEVFTPRAPGATGEETVFSHERQRHVAHGERFALAREIIPTEGMASVPRRYVQRNVWHDGTWYHWVEGERTLNLTGRAVPGDVFSLGFLFNVMEGRVPSYRTLAEQVRTGRPLSSGIEDDVITYRFEPHDAPAGRSAYEVRIRGGEMPRLLEYAVEAFEHDGAVAAPRMIARQTFTISRWQPWSGVEVPAEALLVNWRERNPDASGPSPVEMRVHWKRTAIGEPPVGESGEADGANDAADPDDSRDVWLRGPAPAVGMRVHDSRGNVSYAIGKRYLYVDGALYELDAPIQGFLTGSLAELLRTARPARAEEGPDTDLESAAPAVAPVAADRNADVDAGSGARIGSAVFWGMVVALGVIVLLAVRHAIARW